ncbi:L-seryl-tRNA(Sec) selenium transferase [Striga asiatica]|uniref:L-seryl-tRNA(Sec) selenium transferase n=1 Tax=Striga asiatica TaxID=4170 RepID=A0A5A7NXM9_STRAF|nr:L-seryl-tRNA(Sec) selenium transferase [Striga asiatica]
MKTRLSLTRWNLTSHAREFWGSPTKPLGDNRPPNAGHSTVTPVGLTGDIWPPVNHVRDNGVDPATPAGGCWVTVVTSMSGKEYARVSTGRRLEAEGILGQWREVAGSGGCRSDRLKDDEGLVVGEKRDDGVGLEVRLPPLPPPPVGSRAAGSHSSIFFPSISRSEAELRRAYGAVEGLVENVSGGEYGAAAAAWTMEKMTSSCSGRMAADARRRWGLNGGCGSSSSAVGGNGMVALRRPR